MIIRCRNAFDDVFQIYAGLLPDPYYQAPKSHKSYASTSKQSSSTRSNASTKYKGKEISKPITPPSESTFEEDSDPEQDQRDKDMQKNLTLIAKYFKKIYKPTNNNLKTSLNSRSKNIDASPRYKNDNQTRQFRNQMTVIIARARETIGSQVVQQTVIQCFNYKEFGHFVKECKKPKRDTDKDIDEQELEAHYSYMAKIQEVPTADSEIDTEPLEKVDSTVIPDSPGMCDNDIQTDQNVEECDDERVAPANLIVNLTLDTEENQKILKQLKKANASLTQELKVCKSNLEESNTTWDSCLIALQKLVNQSWEKHSHDHFRAPTAHDIEILIKTCLMPLALKTQNDSFKFVHELKQEMHADLKYVESLEKEIDELESDKADFSNMYDLLLQECVLQDVKCSYLHSLSDLDAHTELQCLYLHKVKECECLAQKLSKQTETVSKEVNNKLLKSFANLDQHLISLEVALQQCQEQMKNDTICKEKASTVFLKEREQYFEIQDLKPQLQDKNISISELKKLIEKCKGKSMETKFDKPSVVRQPNAQRIPKPSVLGKPTPFSDSLERKSFSKIKSVPKTSVSGGLSKSVTSQSIPHTTRQAIRNKNMIKPGMYQIDTRTIQTKAPQFSHTFRNTDPHMSTSTGVIHRTNISKPPLRSTQMKDKVVPNNSQVKFKKSEVEDHHRISSNSNKTKSITACNDSLKSRLYVNVVCSTCGKCVFNSNHDACVSKFIHNINARTKKPKVVPISTSKPKIQLNKSVATPPKKIVASESTIQKSKSYYKMLYEKTSKAWKWWIAQQCPSGYKWVPKTKIKWVPKTKNENVKKRVSFTIDNASRITNVLKLINNLGSNLSNVPLSTNSLTDCLTHHIHYLVQGNIMINRFYYVEGLNHNLFSVGQFCNADLEVAFRKSTCFVRDLQVSDLLNCTRRSDLYTISLQETTSSTPVCFMAKALPTQACKAKRSSFKTKVVPSSKGWLNLLHMDLCGPMPIKSINGKKYILVIVDDYSRYTWTLFLRSKDETPEVLKDFLKMMQRNLQAQVIFVWSDRGTEFLNKTLHAYFKEERIEHQTSTPQTPEQNGVVKRQNRTLVEVAQTMLSASKLPLFFWVEAITTACYTQNKSIIILTHEKTSYHIINDRKPSIRHFTSLVALVT
ncbi:retrovirus-related pol polyprotein from transposon TNT 1-94 [Tanacetum coccineum]|uniref:Retrovirus-related pol polyprotein from transposon TNT 1-94 n=1 Tax=Tanacetum coccineum TaxID=301880 RepID=A0ABQ4X723_9ASTR